ncbi:unnamed protein product [Cladocopium goreaui]|uniref:Protein terminal ear1 n=1 Tax=Cladocopium goreaui TaxID=2562237 RepID=A0A9P1CJW6_9DINO|nr:unnamed protein product [Cladocopium goreaui]
MPQRSHASSSSFSPGSTPRDASSSDREASEKAGFSQTLVRALAKFATDGSSPSTGSQETTELGSEDASFQSMDASAAAALSGQTTVMLKNVPLKYSQRKLLRELLSAGFQGKMDFMYLPIDPRTRASRGFAFCNFTSPQAAEHFYSIFHRKRLKSHSAEVTLEVAAAEVQGFEANAEHYFEVKASRKEKGRDTLGCPVFLRPLPPNLLASFRGFEKAEIPEPVAEASQPHLTSPVAPNPVAMQQCLVEQCMCGRIASHGDFCPYCGHTGNATSAGVLPAPAPGLSRAGYPGSHRAQPTVVGPSFWI